MKIEDGTEPIIELKGKVLNTGILMRPDGAGTEEAQKAEIARLEAESIKATIDILECIEYGDMSRDLLLDPETDVKAEITRLENELVELTK